MEDERFKKIDEKLDALIKLVSGFDNYDKTVRALLETVNAHCDKIMELEKVSNIQARAIVTLQNQIQEMFKSMANATAQMGHGATEPEPKNDD